MGRKSSYPAEAIYAAVGAEVAEKGSVTIQGLSARIGIPTGSIYHRFASREALLAETWLHAVRAFQAEFLAAIRRAAPDAGEQAALATPRFCRSHRDAAVVLMCCRREEFAGPDTPPDLAAQIADANDQVRAAVRRFAERIDRPLIACRLGLIAYPLAVVRLFLPKERVPEDIDWEVVKAYVAAVH